MGNNNIHFFTLLLLFSLDPTYHPHSLLKEKFCKLLESKQGAVEALFQLLYPEMKDEHVKLNRSRVHQLVFKYETQQNCRISMGSWRAIFEKLGYLNDFNDCVEQFNRKYIHSAGKYMNR